MFDIGWTEMLVVTVVAIVVVGPKDLPKVLRAVGGFVRQMRRLANEFRGGVAEFMREAELDEVKNSIHHVSNFDPARHPDFVANPPGATQSGSDAGEGSSDAPTSGAAKGAVSPKTDDGKGGGG
ncbi:MAG: twin-arginine translocase subunit TatB [Alphaproteobacteria bacterium]|nr:MAG: twin-arginine translocase subunit TatB [Alphaproteobacteria bacterium]